MKAQDLTTIENLFEHFFIYLLAQFDSINNVPATNNSHTESVAKVAQDLHSHYADNINLGLSPDRKEALIKDTFSQLQNLLSIVGYNNSAKIQEAVEIISPPQQQPTPNIFTSTTTTTTSTTKTPTTPDDDELFIPSDNSPVYNSAEYSTLSNEQNIPIEQSGSFSQVPEEVNAFLNSLKNESNDNNSAYPYNAADFLSEFFPDESEQNNSKLGKASTKDIAKSNALPFNDYAYQRRLTETKEKLRIAEENIVETREDSEIRLAIEASLQSATLNQFAKPQEKKKSDNSLTEFQGEDEYEKALQMAIDLSIESQMDEQMNRRSNDPYDAELEAALKASLLTCQSADEDTMPSSPVNSNTSTLGIYGESRKRKLKDEQGEINKDLVNQEKDDDDVGRSPQPKRKT